MKIKKRREEIEIWCMCGSRWNSNWYTGVRVDEAKGGDRGDVWGGGGGIDDVEGVLV